ncbi:Leucyl-cystinyl aminopeptidase [Larimichthys crocea]|uniref:Uncharacterized protein n=1 Tax=Larimichthys crocea TaxID=215358 RepID=A0ACD3Q9X2_LARCR|nr:Leucyl-cystinyl aminopeptidase [Larimichthys crocea]
MDPFDSNSTGERANLPRNMIENSMFEEEPDVVDLAKDSAAFPTFPALDPDEVAYEPRSSRLLVRGLGENDMDEDEEDCESSARLLGMSFMNRSSAHRSSSSPYTRQAPPRSCSRPSARTMVVCVLFLVIVASMTMTGCRKPNKTTPFEPVYPVSTNGELFPWAQYRLPQSLHPLSYNVTLSPNLDSMTFTGCTVITMIVQHNTKRIVLHSAGHNITKATFKLGEGEPRDVTVLEYKPKQQIAVKFSEELKAGQTCVLTLDYSANLSHTYDGFYNSSYTDKDGNKRVLAATQFEPLSARKAFPCFDEPAFKATFLIKIKRKPAYMTLSNMPKAQTTKLSDDLFQDEFEKTSVNMSTYLVAFVVADFTPISKNVSETLVSVYSVPEKKEHTDYALDTASKLLEFYNNFFEITYPLKKLDLVAIPDFLAGAMENWGLITFRETSLLVGKQSSTLEKQVVASVIAHELAHQWFGNLVTMSWWNDLWLNEGFATYMQYMSLQTVLPKLDIGNLFLAVRFRALDKDALNSSHAVSTEVNTPEQVEEMFDSVSYEKGASILLMLNASLPGDQQFRKGIMLYLKTFSGLNTDTDNLWNSLTQVEVPTQHLNVSKMMSSWTSQKGFPLVTVSRKGDEVTLTQEHFLLTSENATRTSSLWNIPVTYVNDSCSLDPRCRQLVTLETKSVKGELLKKSFFSPGVNRLGRVSFQHVLNLLNYMPNETETSPVTEALLQLNNIYQLLDKRQEQYLVARMKNYIMSLFGSLMDNQTWTEEESVSKQELRSALLETACGLKRINCIQKAKALFKQYVESNGTFRKSCSVWLLNQMKIGRFCSTSTDTATYDSEKRKMLRGLASTQDVRRIVWILKAGLKGDPIQTQELPLVINAICNGFAGYLFAWDFIQENWDSLIEKFHVGSFAIQTIVKSATSQFSTKAHLDQSEGARFSDEERSGSFGNHQAEPAVDGQEPAYAPKISVIEVLTNRQPGARRQDNSSVCTIVGPCLLTPFIQARVLIKARSFALPGCGQGGSFLVL